MYTAKVSVSSELDPQNELVRLAACQACWNAADRDQRSDLTCELLTAVRGVFQEGMLHVLKGPMVKCKRIWDSVTMTVYKKGAIPARSRRYVGYVNILKFKPTVCI